MIQAFVSPLRLPLLTAALLLAFTASVGAGAEPSGACTLTVRSGRYSIETIEEGGRTFRRIVCDEPGLLAEPGRPALPERTLLVGVPEGSRARVEIVSGDSIDIPGMRIAPAPRDTLVGPDRNPVLLPAFDVGLYASAAWFPPEIARAGEPGRFRHQTIVPIRVSTFRTVPSTGLLRVYRDLVLRVSFEPEPAKRETAYTEPAGEDPHWKSVYARTIANADEAASYRARKARVAPVRTRTEVPELKLAVRESGVYRVDWEELDAAGLPAGVPADAIVLARREYSDEESAAGRDPFLEVEIPVLVEDRDSDGLFGAGDRLFAYLAGFREDRMKRDNDDRWASEAVYFLSVGDPPPLPERPGWRGYEGLAPVVSFPDSVRWEIDAYYDNKTMAESLDVYYPASNVVSFFLELPVPPVDTNGTYEIKAKTVNVYSSIHPYHRYVIGPAEILDSAYVDTLSGNSIPGDTAIVDTVFDETTSGPYPAVRMSSGLHDASWLARKVNRFSYRGSRGATPDAPITGALGFLDWFEVHAPFLYRAWNDRARFSTGKEIGRVQMEVGGFTTPDVVVFDATDRFAPVRVVADSVRFEEGAFTIVLQDSVSATRVYAAATAESALRLPEGKIVRETPSALHAEEGDYLIVAYDDFLGAVEPLASFREEQGYRVVRAKISDVYDEFNGGIKHPLAIQRWLRYAFERWETPPVYVLLVGDAYEEARTIATNRTPGDADYVPTYLMFFRGSFADGNEWVASDARYALLDGTVDYAPEMIVGRLPVGSVAETEALVAKTIAYETERREEPWRRGVGFLADDAWVKDSSIPYHDGLQTAFESASFDFAKRLAGNTALRADTATFFLSRYTDVFRSLCPYDPPSPIYADHPCVLDLTKDPVGGATPRAFDFLNDRGLFFVNYQGHGNRTSLTHELLIVHGKDTAFGTVPLRTDLATYSLAGAAPYVFLAFGCAISEFDVFSSFGFDALGENMILLPDRGGILTYGSTGIEYLGPNIRLNGHVLDQFFPTLEKEAALGGQGAETIGEMLTAGMVAYAFDTFDRGPLQRYAILGDPALAVGPREPLLDVALEGETVPDGAVRIPPADGSPWGLEARFRSDVYVDSAGVRVLENGAPIDDSLYSVDGGVDSSTGRWLWTVSFERPQDPDLRTIAFEFTDIRGNRSLHTLKTYAEIALFIDAVAYSESLVVSSSCRALLEFEADEPPPLSEIRIAAAGAVFPADTLYRSSDSTWTAGTDLVLPEGEQDLLATIGGLERKFPVRVAKSSVFFAGCVDGAAAASGVHLLGHLDGTPPELVVRIEALPGVAIDSVRALAGDEVVPPDLYELEPETTETSAGLRLAYAPSSLEEGRDIRIEAWAAGEASAFLFRVSLPIEIRSDGATLLDGDFVAPASEIRAVALFAGEIPAEEAAFFVDDVPLPPDTLRREGNDRWIAVLRAETTGGSHEIVFRAGAFAASREVRVENTLRIVEPLAFPNPAEGRAGFFYSLTLPADDVRVEILTVTGRRIRVLEGLSARAGHNENRDAWDGRDADGDEIARGAYLFRVVATRAGEKAEAIGKLVVGGDER